MDPKTDNNPQNSLEFLWDLVHGLPCVYDFDTTMSAAELRDSLEDIFQLEAGKILN